MVVETCIGFFDPPFSFKVKDGNTGPQFIGRNDLPNLVAWCRKNMSVPVVNDEQKYDAGDNENFVDKAHHCEG
jgi:hypothetical protein